MHKKTSVFLYSTPLLDVSLVYCYDVKLRDGGMHFLLLIITNNQNLNGFCLRPIVLVIPYRW